MTPARHVVGASEAHKRIRLALSILLHRSFCPECRVHVDAAVLALQGATIAEVEACTSTTGR